jgi:hypothetical protein
MTTGTRDGAPRTAMTTDELIGLLARHADPVPPGAIARRLRAALAWGAVPALLLMLWLLGLRPDLGEAVHQPMFWVKLLFPVVLLAVSLPIAARLARPGMRAGKLPVLIAVPLALVWLMAAVELVSAAPAARPALVLGSSWRQCPLDITLLSVPAFIATFAAMRRLAPVHLRAAGAAAGLVAGTLAAAIYALHCDETAATFLGLWYVIGMLIPAAAGALLAPRLLRW